MAGDASGRGGPSGGPPGLLLDVDGTLFDTFDAILASMNDALGELEEPPLEAVELRPLIGTPVHHQMPRLRSMDRDAVDALRERYYVHFGRRVEAGLPLYPGVRRTLESLADRPIGTMTTRRTAVARRMLEGADILDLFAAVVGGDRVDRPKPAADLVLLAAQSVGRPPTRCVAVGDAPVDIQAGRAAGARTVAVTYGYGDADELRRAGADAAIAAFPGLPAVLDRLDAGRDKA